jgi:DNA-binding ferritin-like protein
MALAKLQRPAPMGPCTETAQLIANLQGMTTAAHRLHLKVNGDGSYAAHKALQDFYDAIPGLIDEVAEQYQGAREKLLDIPMPKAYTCKTPMEAVSHLKEIYEEVSDLQKLMPFSEVTNQLDEIKSVIASTKYKLLFLR